MNESPTQDAAPATEPNPPPAGAEPPPAPEPPLPVGAEPPPAAPAIAPDVPRLERPIGTSSSIPETILAHRPSPVFLAVLAVVTFVADVSTKLWAEARLEDYPRYVKVVDEHLMFVLAKNKGGAWGLLQGQSENVRIPFFLLVSAAAIAFIVTLYRRLLPSQHALKWGLPLVLGGALGNVFDRIRYGYVIDFIDYRADWVRKLNELVASRVSDHVVTDHWPTFNVADVAICVGVGLMAVDMLVARRSRKPSFADVPVEPDVAPPAATEAPPAEPEAPAQTVASTEEPSDTAAEATFAPEPEAAAPTKSDA